MPINSTRRLPVSIMTRGSGRLRSCSGGSPFPRFDLTNGSSLEAVARLLRYPAWGSLLGAISDQEGGGIDVGTKLDHAAVDACFLPRLGALMMVGAEDARALFHVVRPCLQYAIRPYLADPKAMPAQDRGQREPPTRHRDGQRTSRRGAARR